MEIKHYFFIFYYYLIFSKSFIAEEKITSTPLINLENLKPSFEEPKKMLKKTLKKIIKKRKKKKLNLKNLLMRVLIGLDKITAKSSKINCKFRRN